MASEITSKIQTPLDGPTQKFSVQSSEIDLQCKQSQVIASVAGMDTGQILLYPPGFLSSSTIHHDGGRVPQWRNQRGTKLGYFSNFFLDVY